MALDEFGVFSSTRTNEFGFKCLSPRHGSYLNEFGQKIFRFLERVTAVLGIDLILEHVLDVHHADANIAFAIKDSNFLRNVKDIGFIRDIKDGDTLR